MTKWILGESKDPKEGARMRKKYDYGWLAKVAGYGISAAALIYFAICTACVWFDVVEPWNIWQIIAK